MYIGYSSCNNIKYFCIENKKFENIKLSTLIIGNGNNYFGNYYTKNSFDIDIIIINNLNTKI